MNGYIRNSVPSVQASKVQDIMNSNKKQEEDVSAYKELKSKFKPKDALSYIALKKILKSFDASLDEYLAVLQLELELSLVLNEFDTYKKEKQKKVQKRICWS